MTLKKHSRLMGLVQGILFSLVGAGFAGFLMFPNCEQDGKLSALAALLFIITAAFFSGVIAAFGGVNTARQDYLHGKIELEPADQEKAAALPPPRRPMWLVPLVDSTVLWLAFAVLAAGVVYGLFPGGVSRAFFAVLAAAVMGLHAALTAAYASGRELLKYVAHPPAAGSGFGPYVLREHVSGNSLINYGINSLCGYLFFHAGPNHPESLVAFSELMIDTLIMGVLIALLVPIGAAMQAANDVGEARVAAPSRSTHPNWVIRNLAFQGAALLCALVLGGTLWLAGIETLGLLPVMTVKGLISAVMAGVVAILAAYWSAAKSLVAADS